MLGFMAPLSPVVFLIGFSMKQKININTKPKQNHFSNKGPTPPPPHLQASPTHPRPTHPTPPPVESTPPLPQPNQPKDKANKNAPMGRSKYFCIEQNQTRFVQLGKNPFGSYPTRHISPIGSCSPPNTFYPDFARDFQKYQSDSVRT